MSRRQFVPYRRTRKQFWMRLFVWVFLVIFTFSVVGGVIAFTVRR